MNIVNSERSSTINISGSHFFHLGKNLWITKLVITKTAMMIAITDQTTMPQLLS
jgi:hypothetical protein